MSPKFLCQDWSSSVNSRPIYLNLPTLFISRISTQKQTFQIYTCPKTKCMRPSPKHAPLTVFSISVSGNCVHSVAWGNLTRNLLAKPVASATKYIKNLCPSHHFLFPEWSPFCHDLSFYFYLCQIWIDSDMQPEWPCCNVSLILSILGCKPCNGFPFYSKENWRPFKSLESHILSASSIASQISSLTTSHCQFCCSHTYLLAGFLQYFKHT